LSEFTPEEAELIRPFFTNLDKPVFGLINMPEAVKGALFSRYSRSTKSLRRTLLDDFLKDTKSGFNEIVGDQVARGTQISEAIKKAEDFYTRVLDGYGDDSVAELGGAHLAIENISNLATKKLQDSRLTSPLEKSSRYVFFHHKENGDYRYFKDPMIMQSEFNEEYVSLMRLLFGTYEKLIEPLTAFAKKKLPIDDFKFFDPILKREITLQEVSEERKKVFETAYNAAVRALACDNLRYLLPAATLTNTGIFANGRSWEYLIRKAYSDDLSEMPALAKVMHEELNQIIPSFIKRAKKDEYLFETRVDFDKHVREKFKEHKVKRVSDVELIFYDKNAEDKILSTILYPHTRLPLSQILKMAKKMLPEEKAAIFARYVGNRKSRRDKPGRAFENVGYTFDVLTDFGAYRDIQRHRILTQQREDLTTTHGFEVPELFIEAGFDKEFRKCMKKANELYQKIYMKHPKEAQYVVPFAYKIRWYMTMNLREAFHFVELRSIKQGHPSYRKIAQRCYELISKVHPSLAAHMNFVDMNDYSLARIDSEVKTQQKRADRGEL